MGPNRRFDPRRDPDYRRCPVEGCRRGYMISHHKGCKLHRQEGLAMWRDGSHPESKTWLGALTRWTAQGKGHEPTGLISAYRRLPANVRRLLAGRLGIAVVAVATAAGFATNDVARTELVTQHPWGQEVFLETRASIFWIQTSVDIQLVQRSFAPPVPTNDYYERYETGRTVRVGALCRDGSQSSATGQGACSWHGGVSVWLYGPEVGQRLVDLPEPPQPPDPPPDVGECSNHSTSPLGLCSATEWSLDAWDRRAMGIVTGTWTEERHKLVDSTD